MRVHRFHFPDLAAGAVTVVGAEASHLIQVLRVTPGQRLKAFDGRGWEAFGTVVEVESSRLTVEFEEPVPSDSEADLPVTLAVALLKGDKLADVVRQGTELGAVRFRPFISRRCDVPQLSANKLERLRRVAREAAKQCGRSVVPVVDEAVALRDLDLEEKVVVAHPAASGTLSQLMADEPGRLTVLTGPEGGFDPGEIDWLRERGATEVRLGNRILRAETAPVAILAALLLPEAR